MDLTRLQAFVAVVRGGSFTAAADVLGRQKAQLSRQVSALETQLGVRLLERSTRSLHLTEVGREVFERALGILQAVEDTERMAQSVHGEPMGTLRVTMPLEFGLVAGFGWVRALLQRYPRLAIEVDSSARLVDLVHEGFDLAVRVGPLPDSRLAARRLGALHYGRYASPGYARRHGLPDTPAALEAHARVVFAPGGRPGPARGPAAAARLRVDSRFAQLDALLAGLGIGETLDILAAPHVAAGRLLPVLPDAASPPVPVHAVFPSTLFLTPKVRTFVEHALANFPDGAGAGAALISTATLDEAPA